MTDWTTLLLVALIAHVVLVLSMCRVSARAERMARRRRRAFRQSLTADRWRS